jgi:hypothetical protein
MDFGGATGRRFHMDEVRRWAESKKALPEPGWKRGGADATEAIRGISYSPPHFRPYGHQEFGEFIGGGLCHDELNPIPTPEPYMELAATGLAVPARTADLSSSVDHHQQLDLHAHSPRLSNKGEPEPGCD